MNYPQLLNSETGAEQNFSRIYGSNFMISLAISVAQGKKNLLLFHNFFLNKIVPWIFGKKIYEKVENSLVCMKLQLSFK